MLGWDCDSKVRRNCVLLYQVRYKFFDLNKDGNTEIYSAKPLHRPKIVGYTYLQGCLVRVQLQELDQDLRTGERQEVFLDLTYLPLRHGRLLSASCLLPLCIPATWPAFRTCLLSGSCSNSSPRRKSHRYY